MVANSTDSNLQIKAKLMVFFSTWTMPMIRWYMEVKYGSTFEALKEECNSTVEHLRKEGRISKLYNECLPPEHIGFLAQLVTFYKYEYVETRYNEVNGNPKEFLLWIEENLNESFRDMYNIYLLGLMDEWLTYTEYKYLRKIESRELRTLSLETIRQIGENLSSDEEYSFNLLRTDYKRRIEETDGKYKFDIFLKYKYIVQDGSLEILFNMLNCNVKPEERDKREFKKEILMRIKHIGLSEYFQSKYNEFRTAEPSAIEMKFSNHAGKSGAIYLPPKINTDLAQSVFTKALRKGYMIQNGSKYEWKLSLVLLAYLCGKLYCDDFCKTLVDGSVVWANTSGKNFPRKSLSNIFDGDIGATRINRMNTPPPKDYDNIDLLFKE